MSSADVMNKMKKSVVLVYSEPGPLIKDTPKEEKPPYKE